MPLPFSGCATVSHTVLPCVSTVHSAGFTVGATGVVTVVFAVPVAWYGSVERMSSFPSPLAKTVAVFACGANTPVSCAVQVKLFVDSNGPSQVVPLEPSGKVHVRSLTEADP